METSYALSNEWHGVGTSFAVKEEDTNVEK
jgi:hypothetical protein